jgi:hypothetical protein
VPLIHPFAIAAFRCRLAYHIAEVNYLVDASTLSRWRGARCTGLYPPAAVIGEAGLVTSFVIFIFISYGHVYAALAKIFLAGFTIGRHRYLVVIYALALIAGL